MNPNDDPYEVLGLGQPVTTTATATATATASQLLSEDEIKKAYRRLALKHHPDRQSNEHERDVAHDAFAKINEAYATLMDPVKLHDWRQKQLKVVKNKCQKKKATSVATSTRGGMNMNAGSKHSSDSHSNHSRSRSTETTGKNTNGSNRWSRTTSLHPPKNAAAAADKPSTTKSKSSSSSPKHRTAPGRTFSWQRHLSNDKCSAGASKGGSSSARSTRPPTSPKVLHSSVGSITRKFESLNSTKYPTKVNSNGTLPKSSMKKASVATIPSPPFGDSFTTAPTTASNKSTHVPPMKPTGNYHSIMKSPGGVPKDATKNTTPTVPSPTQRRVVLLNSTSIAKPYDESTTGMVGAKWKSLEKTVGSTPEGTGGKAQQGKQQSSSDRRMNIPSNVLYGPRKEVVAPTRDRSPTIITPLSKVLSRSFSLGRMPSKRRGRKLDDADENGRGGGSADDNRSVRSARTGATRSSSRKSSSRRRLHPRDGDDSAAAAAVAAPAAAAPRIVRSSSLGPLPSSSKRRNMQGTAGADHGTDERSVRSGRTTATACTTKKSPKIDTRRGGKKSKEENDPPKSVDKKATTTMSRAHDIHHKCDPARPTTATTDNRNKKQSTRQRSSSLGRPNLTRIPARVISYEV